MEASLVERKGRQVAAQEIRRQEREKVMSIFKRGNVYWYHFWFNRQHIQESTKQGNRGAGALRRDLTDFIGQD